MTAEHQYIERKSACVKKEILFADRLIKLIWSDTRENSSLLFKMLSSATMSDLLAFFTYDFALGTKLSGMPRFAKNMGIDLSECVNEPQTPRELFERRIRYWQTRPMPADPNCIVSPADARMLPGSFARTSCLFLKEKFFDYAELLSGDHPQWLDEFRNGDYAVFRLTPDKYHYNHVPVSGKVVDFYEIQGNYSPCNPGAVMTICTPYSKNKRAVTIIDTDADSETEPGTHAGLVAMIEIAALMIGDIVQCCSEEKYDSPRPVCKGMFVKKGQPKSLYRPGSSTDVLIFQKNRVTFSPDIVSNSFRTDAQTRFSEGFGRSLVETEVAVRSEIGRIQ